jgi:drug/metabolite transporter (DMT)-like permease
MSSLIAPQFIALAAALSYAASGIAAKRGLRYSTPIIVTLVSVTVHAVSLSIALWLTGGIPEVSWWVLFLFALTGTLQPATSPLWILIGTWLFLRGIESLTLRTILGAVCVVSGTIAISVVR